MSTRVVLSGAIVIGMAGFALGYYFRGEPVTPAAAPVAAEPTVVEPPAAVRQPTVERATDPVQEHNRRVGRMQPFADAIGDKMARVGDELVTLHFKNTPTMKWRGAQIDYTKPGFFEPLAELAANGDDAATHQLWQSLQACREVPQTQAEIREQIGKVEEMFAKTGGAGPDGKALTLEQMRQEVQSRYDRCQGVTLTMHSEGLEYLRQAADRGDHEIVAIEYAAAIAKDQPEESRRRFQTLWEQGSLGALGALGKDSLPHELAWQAAQIALFDGLPEPNPTLLFLRSRAAKLQNETSLSEYNEAAKEAARLLRSNPNCCIH